MLHIRGVAGRVVCLQHTPEGESVSNATSCKGKDGDTWEIYTDRGGDWRWRRTASNGRIVGASSEGYSTRSACVANAKRNGMDCEPS